MHEQEPVAMLRHPHEFRSNQTLFEYNGRTYQWNWTQFLGAKHSLMSAPATWWNLSVLQQA